MYIVLSCILGAQRARGEGPPVLRLLAALVIYPTVLRPLTRCASLLKFHAQHHGNRKEDSVSSVDAGSC
jgi:hypothetical protein